VGIHIMLSRISSQISRINVT